MSDGIGKPTTIDLETIRLIAKIKDYLAVTKGKALNLELLNISKFSSQIDHYLLVEKDYVKETVEYERIKVEGTHLIFMAPKGIICNEGFIVLVEMRNNEFCIINYEKEGALMQIRIRTEHLLEVYFFHKLKNLINIELAKEELHLEQKNEEVNLVLVPQILEIKLVGELKKGGNIVTYGRVDKISCYNNTIKVSVPKGMSKVPLEEFEGKVVFFSSVEDGILFFQSPEGLSYELKIALTKESILLREKLHEWFVTKFTW